MVSSGFDTTMTMARGACFLISSATDFTMSTLVRSRSSRLMPGRRAMPAVTTNRSDPAVAA